jgi:uncharacterized membrane protein
MSGADWLAVRWLHVLAMALFVGGQLMLLVAVIPALRDGQRPALRSIARRFGWASLAALGVLIATGTALASHDMRWSSGTLHVKLTLVVTVGALIGWHLRRPNAHAIEGLVFLVSLAIVWLGLALAHGPLPFG